MNKLIIGLCTSIVFIQQAMAQPAQLMIRHDDKGLHLNHSVAAKEGFYSIGRLYSVHPKFLAAYNNIDLNKGLSIGQVLRVPLTDTNFSQKNNKGTPIYYSVGEKEGLMKISNANNRVTMQNLRDWNKLSSDDIKPGSKLIVGFLVANGAPVTVSAAVKTEPAKKPEDKPVVRTEQATEKPIVKEESAKKAEDKSLVKSEPVVERAIVKEEPKKEEPKKEEPKKEDPKKEEPKQEEAKKIFVKQDVTTNMSGQGYFKSFFDQQTKAIPISKTETVTSGIFKTTSGFQDAKFYLLIDGVASGTIVRIINPENNRAIYAKVLGEMNGIRQNQGLDIRVSNAAASTLGISDTDKFIVKINY